MQFNTGAASTEPAFMGTWPNTETNLLFRMSQQAIRCTLVNCTCECFQPGKINLRTCDQCKHGWVAHALDKLSTQHLYHPTQVEIVQSNVVFDISSLMLYGTQAVPVRLKILLDRLFSVLKQEEVLQILHGLGWTLRDYVRGYILQDAAGKVLDRWAIMSREEEIITLQQFLRFGETKSIVELMAIQEKEGQAVAVATSKADSDIRTFIEGSNRTRSPSLQAHLENSNPSSVHHFENIPNSLAFLLPFQYINPVSAPLLGLPPNGVMLEQPSLRLREPNLPLQNEHVESSESEVSISPFRSDQSGSRNALSSIINIEPKNEQKSMSPIHTPSPANDPVKSDHSKASILNAKIQRMRRNGLSPRKGRVVCNACGKTFYDKGTLKIHYNAVHLKIKHRCTIEGCNMVFSSLRSRNRHSANPNPRLHMPMLRNNRDKDLIRATSGAATPVISSIKSNLSLSSPGRPSLGFSSSSVDPVLQSPLVFPSLKTVQPVPPFYRSLLTSGDMVCSPNSLPTSPIMPVIGSLEQPCGLEQLPPAVQELAAELAPKKKSRKSSMPVKIEKEVIGTADEFDEDDQVNENHVNSDIHDEEMSNGNGHKSISPAMHMHVSSNADDERSLGGFEDKKMGSITSEDHEQDRDFEDESEGSESKMCDDVTENEEQTHRDIFDKDEMSDGKNEDKDCVSPLPQTIKIKEEFCDPTYDMFYSISQYGLYNGGAGSMAALQEGFASSMGYGSPQKYSPESELCSSPDPKICYVCKKSFKSSYSVKLHYKNVHLKEMHVCTVEGCNAAFPSRRSRDRHLIHRIPHRHSANINLHRKLLTKELDEMGMDPAPPLAKDLREEFLAKIYGGHHGIGLDMRDEASSPAGTEDSHINGYTRVTPDDYMVLDLSTTSSIQSSSSIHSSRESEVGSDEGILLDEMDGASDSGESAHRAEVQSQAAGSSHEALEASILQAASTSNGGIMCIICHKMYSNKGTLRVHYKTVHLREMHKCKVPGCNMMFSSLRSRNRHSQNPNLHKNIPYASID
ncbi:zinc finger protein basonuclin-2 isoform X1 [Amblyraja radiata]|uniref:zinc finger protein basonuclin-2 isoform X1 n=2 Tax=Amblyraja radiata TaxID=386614 RepID=UPI001403F822|nr:zinc finger protein basonuclin-2 isoform X1 [Amblyraja radiata]